MDKMDNTILEILRKNARTPFMQIAKRLQVSEGTIRKRVNDMVENGIITRFTLETKKDISMIVGIQTNTKKHTKLFVKKIEYIGVEQIYEVTGRYDIICLISGLDTHTINEKLERIRVIPGVILTETFTILEKG